jgi:hypothetical protein
VNPRQWKLPRILSTFAQCVLREVRSPVFFCGSLASNVSADALIMTMENEFRLVLLASIACVFCPRGFVGPCALLALKVRGIGQEKPDRQCLVELTADGAFPRGDPLPRV